MSLEPTLSRAELAPSEPPDPLSDASWANRSTAELRQIMSHGVLAGNDFQNAAREIERRARVTTIGTEDDEIEHRLQQIRFGRYLLLGLALIFVVSLSVGLLL